MKRLGLLLLLFLVLLAWETASQGSSIVRFFVSSPSLSVKYAFTNSSALLDATVTTALEAVAGFGIAIIFSFVIMFLCLLYPPVFRVLLPVFVTSQILPIITLAPLFIVLFGIGLQSKIAMVVLMCFFPTFVNFSAGINSIPRTVYELLFLYNTGRVFTIFRVLIPLSAPYTFAGLKVSTTMAIMGAIVAEFVGARSGLGKNLYLAPKNSLPELMVCSIFLTALLGWVLFQIVSIMERRLVRWQSNSRG